MCSRNVLAAILPAAKPLTAARAVGSLRPTLIDLGPSSLLQTLLSLIAAPTLSRAAQIPAIRAAFAAGRANHQPLLSLVSRRLVPHGSGGLLNTLWSLSWQLFPALVGLYRLKGGSEGQFNYEYDDRMQLARGSPDYLRQQALQAARSVQGFHPVVQPARSVGGEVPHWCDSSSSPVTLYCIHQTCSCHRRPAPEHRWSACVRR